MAAPHFGRRLGATATLTLLAACGAGRSAPSAPSGAPAAAAIAPTTTAPAMHYASALISGASSPAADPLRKKKLADVIPRLDDLFTKSVAANHIAGLAVGMVLDGEVVYMRGFGVQSLETKAPFDTDSVFRIASVTKGFTAMAILKLRDEGKLQLETPAALYYPPLTQLAYPTRDSSPITVRDLLSHGGGLPEDNFWIDAAGTVSDEKLASLLASGMRFSSAPGSGYEYSNTGYALLGKIIEHVSGTQAREYIRREILRPLGMTHTVWGPEETTRDKVVVGYRGTEGYRVRDATHDEAAPLEPLGVYDAAGGLYASIRDMTRYLAFQLAAWPPRDEPETGPLRRSSVREMHQGTKLADPRSFPFLLLPNHRAASVRDAEGHVTLSSSSYGFGFFATSTCDDVLAYRHSGGLPGYTTMLAFYPTRRFGIVMFVNDERMESDPSDEAVALLRDAGVIDPVPAQPVPALDAARAEVEHLLGTWDTQRAKDLFDPTFWHYQPPEKLHEQLAALATAHGRCHGEGPLVVKNLTRGSWKMTCEKGEITFALALSPEAKPHLQTLLWDDTLPATPALQRAAEAAVALLARWEGKTAKMLLAPAVDVTATQADMALLAAKHGQCKIDHALTSNGTTDAKYLLACTRRNVELSLSVIQRADG